VLLACTDARHKQWPGPGGDRNRHRHPGKGRRPYAAAGWRASGPTPVPLPGRVVAESTDGSRYTASVDTNGHYTISLSPGTYRLTGYSPLVRSDDSEMQCRAPHAVQVTAGTTTTGIDVICSIR
jgi:Polysaccharide lyase family 4, domain II